MTTTKSLPDRETMVTAFLHQDATFDGVFVTGVRTTGIFCRPTCSARKPRPDRVEFFASPQEALQAGYRPCLRCRPLEPRGTAPEWLRDLLRRVEEDPSRRWTESDLRGLGLHPDRVRRWFRTHHGMTFHAYSRARRLGSALGRIQHGGEVTDSAFASGYESLSGFNEAFRRLLGTAPTDARDAVTVKITRIPTPLGPMVAGATDDGLCLLEFVDRRMLPRQLDGLRIRLRCHFLPGGHSILDRTAAELTEYFSGERREFSVPLITPGTPFQQQVWEALREIPGGRTRSYAEIARRIERPTAVRAVARANGDNRVAILVPCHRVIGSDGTLTGYGGGLWRKRRLLEIEAGWYAR